MQLEFFFDCSSPWTYLAFANIQPVAARHGVAIRWRPILVGGIFNTINPSVYAARAQPVPAKARYASKDLQDWARHAGVRIGQPPVFPVNSARAMRGCFFAEAQGLLPEYATRVFARYWGALEDISQPAVLAAIAADCGFDVDEFLAATGSERLREQLRANTDELVARGGFGSPTLFIDRTDMYFGNDRLPLVEARLAAG